MTIPCVPPTQFVLGIESDVHTQAWQHSQTVPPLNRWCAYLNQLSQATILPWIQDEFDPTAVLWQDHATLSGIWNWVNGTAIAVGNHRFILIPDQSLETQEFVVPQEWVDLPGWAGDYYLAVQVDPTGEWLRIWGYITHAQLKAKGIYDASDRTYCLDAIDLIQDVTVLGVVRQLNPTEVTRAAIAPLPTLEALAGDRLIAQLGQQDPSIWRLTLPFEQWGALLESGESRQRLLQCVQPESTVNTRPDPVEPAPPPVNLSQWLQNVFEETWQTLEALLGTQPDLAFNFRRVQSQAETETLTRRARRVRLQTADASHVVLLVLTLGHEPDGRVLARIQLYPLERTEFLPPGLTLTMLSGAGDIVQSVQARDQDDCIQLKRFRCLPRKSFRLQVSLDDASFTETFIS